MKARRSIRNRRSRKRVTSVLDLQLTSMLDILVILLVFLLKSFAIATTNYTTVPGLELPISVSKDTPPDSLHLIITPEAMIFEGDRILDFIQSADSLSSNAPRYKLNVRDMLEGGRMIAPLFDALTKAKRKSEELRAKSSARDEKGNPLPFEGVLAIQADKNINYDILRRVMYTSAAAGYKVFRLLARKKEV